MLSYIFRFARFRLLCICITNDKRMKEMDRYAESEREMKMEIDGGRECCPREEEEEQEE